MSVPGALLVGIAALVGGAVQSVLGFGAAFMLVPALALVAPQLLPGAPLTAFLPLSSLMAYREWGSLDRAGALRLCLARLPGTLLGTAAVAVMSTRALAAAVAIVLLLAVVSTAAGWEVAATRRTEFVYGAVSGFAGTATALGGPPLALLYRDRHSSQTRPTLAVVFLVGIATSLALLAVSGSYVWEQVLWGLALGLISVLGLFVARGTVRRLPEERIRQGVLLWAAVGAVLALIRVVTG